MAYLLKPSKQVNPSRFLIALFAPLDIKYSPSVSPNPKAKQK